MQSILQSIRAWLARRRKRSLMETLEALQTYEQALNFHLVKPCWVCQARISKDAAFCPECGTLQTSGGRRAQNTGPLRPALWYRNYCHPNDEAGPPTQIVRAIHKGATHS